MLQATLRKFIYFVYVLMLIELTLLGSGQLLKVGPLTVRMILFIFATSLSCGYVFFIKRYLSREVFSILLIFSLSIFVSSLIGYANGAQISYILNDVKTLSYIYIFFFFENMITSERNIKTFINVVCIIGIIQCTLYLFLMFLAAIGYINLEEISLLFYDPDESVDISLRPGDQALFFKGFLFLCISCAMYLCRGGLRNRLISIFLLIGIFFTFTRGFLIAIFFSFFIYYFLTIRSKKILLFLSVLMIAGLGAVKFVFDSLYADRDDSDSIRYLQIDQALDSVTIPSFLFGHGLGVGVEVRPVHFEISYLEIFHKQGLIGLVCWGYFGYLLIRYFYSALRNNPDSLPIIKPVFISVILIVVQSATNPFINNPIGMSFLILAFLTLKFYSEKGTSEAV